MPNCRLGEFYGGSQAFAGGVLKVRCVGKQDRFHDLQEFVIFPRQKEKERIGRAFAAEKHAIDKKRRPPPFQYLIRCIHLSTTSTCR